jgi:hypothetical protein
MGFNDVKKSAEAPRVFETGAVRAREAGKGRFDLLPPYPLLRLAQHYENGANKYNDRNWERGLPLHCFQDSAERHMAQFKDGNREEDHLAAVLWNVAGYIWTEREIREGRLPDSLYTVPWPDSTGEPLPKPIEYCANCCGSLDFDDDRILCHCSGAV